MDRRLSYKQRLFVDKYVENIVNCKDPAKFGNASAAVKEAYPNIKTDGARGVMGNYLLKNHNVRSEINAALQALGLTPTVVLKEFVKIAGGAKHDRDRINAWGKVADIAGYTSKQEPIIVQQQALFDSYRDEVAQDLPALTSEQAPGLIEKEAKEIEAK